MPAKSQEQEFTVDRIRSQEQVEERYWEKITSDRTPEICRRLFSERFRNGASLWLVRNATDLVGYGWTQTCNRREFCYPVTEQDVYLFELMVFPAYRGRRINALMVNHIVGQLISEGKVRAYLEVDQWNKAALGSYRHTPFRPVGASKRGLRGRKLVQWISPEDWPVPH